MKHDKWIAGRLDAEAVRLCAISQKYEKEYIKAVNDNRLYIAQGIVPQNVQLLAQKAMHANSAACVAISAKLRWEREHPA